MTDTKEDLARREAPCFIYEKEEIVRRCGILKAALPDVQFLYSVKANPFDPVVRTIAGEGFGSDAASSDEVQKSIRAGVPLDRIFYSAPGKTDFDIRSSLGFCVFIADSIGEVGRIAAIADKAGVRQKIGIRVNPAFGIGGAAPAPSKFGIDEEQLPLLFQIVRNLKSVEVTGIHIHLKSQMLDAGLIADYHRKCFDLAERIAKDYGITVEFVNFGSGIGTVYNDDEEKPVDLTVLSKAFTEIAAKNRETLKAALYIETGRFPTCRAGTYYARVVDKKTSRGVTYLVVTSGLNGFIRPGFAAMAERIAANGAASGLESFYTTKNEFRIEALPAHPVGTNETVTIVGNLCTAVDVIAEGITLPTLEVGDLVAVTNAGAYAATLSPTRFSSHPAPQEFLWEGSRRN